VLLSREPLETYYLYVQLHHTFDCGVAEPEPIDGPDPVRRSSGEPKNWIQAAVTSLMILQLVASTPVPARLGFAPAFQPHATWQFPMQTGSISGNAPPPGSVGRASM